MGNEEKQTISLRDAIARGFENQAAENQEETNGVSDTGTEAVTSSGDPDGAQTAQNVDSQFNTGISPKADGGAPVDGVQDVQGNQTVPPQTGGQAQTGGDNAAMQTLISALNSLRQQNAQLTQMIQNQGKAMEQQSQGAQESIEKTMTVPTLNFRELSYLGEEEQQEAINAWQNDVMSSLMSRVQEEIAPVKKDYEEKRRIAAEDAARSTVFSAPQFSDFAQNAGDIERIIAASPEIAQIEPEKRYMFAGLIARGLKNDPSHKMTTEEIVRLAESNPDVMRALETKRAQSVRDKNAALPTINATSGLSNANPLPQTSPAKNKEELDARIRSRFGL